MVGGKVRSRINQSQLSLNHKKNKYSKKNAMSPVKLRADKRQSRMIYIMMPSHPQEVQPRPGNMTSATSGLKTNVIYKIKGQYRIKQILSTRLTEQINNILFQFKKFVTYLLILNLYKHYTALSVMIFKVRRGEQWNVQELMMDLTLDISCVYRNQENQQQKGRATLIHASLCKLNSFLSPHRVFLNQILLDRRITRFKIS